jgi:hypothetical protein
MRKPLKKPVSMKEALVGALKTPVQGPSKPITVSPPPLTVLHKDWARCVGPTLAKKSWPIRIASGRMLIGVTAASWASEVEFLKREILQRIRNTADEIGLQLPELSDLRTQIATRTSNAY